MDRQARRVSYGVRRDRHAPLPSLDAYTATVGPTRDAVDAMDGGQPGDPDMAAATILDHLDRDDH